jgi:hypothetical protein
MKKEKKIEKLTFIQWFHKTKPDGMSDSKYRKVLEAKSKETNNIVSHETIRSLMLGQRPSYKKAKAIEALTGISAIELIEG